MYCTQFGDRNKSSAISNYTYSADVSAATLTRTKVAPIQHRSCHAMGMIEIFLLVKT